MENQTEVKEVKTNFGFNNPPEIDKEKLNELKEEINFNNEIKEKKRGRGRPRKEDKEKLENERKEREKQEFLNSVNGVGSMLLNMIVVRLPNPKPLTQNEAEMFDNVFNKIAYKYADWLGNYQEETALLAVTGLIIVPRLKKERKNKSVDENVE